MAFRARMQPPPAGPASKTPTPPRVVACRAELNLSWGTVTVRYAILGDDETTIGIVAAESSPGSLVHSGQPQQVQLTDDQGRTATAHFSGSWGNGSLDGVLTCNPPLARHTRWIDSRAGRIDLPDFDPVAPEVEIEDLPPAAPALAHLWRRLATNRGPMPIDDDLKAAIEALVAVGAVDSDSTELGQIRTVASVVGGGWRRMRLGPQPLLPSGIRLPEPWHSLVATQRRSGGRGATGVIAVGAVTPPVDGTVVILGALVSNPDGFEIKVATTPGSGVFGPLFHTPGNPLAWWAEDDRGGVYLGGPGNWGGGADHSSGSIQFGPGLDRRCRELKIMPTGQTQRAVIPIKLRWEEG